jgi:hypothetical protein
MSPRIEGQCMAGGPLNGPDKDKVDIPRIAVVHRLPEPSKPTPLPARRDAGRDYVRAWAWSHGMRCATVGALPKAVTEAYAEALRGQG